MVAQRALPYTEVDTEWILFLDDDIGIEPDGVERMFAATIANNADGCAFDAFPHDKLPLKTRIAMILLLSSVPRIGRREKGYTVNCIGKDIYNPKPKNDVAWSTTNAGGAFICRKEDFIKIHFEDDMWLDDAPNAIPEDKVMFYKMHLCGLRILTHYNSGFSHLDAGTSLMSSDKASKLAYSSARNNYIFNKLYIKPNLKITQKICAFILSGISKPMGWLYERVIRRGRYCADIKRGIHDAKHYLASCLRR